MKCLCIGICQLAAIATILKNNREFNHSYDIILSYTIFTLSVEEMEKILEEIVPTCDLILSQPVSNSYRNNPIFSTQMLRSKIKPGAIHLVIPNCYFTGYDPMPFQITNLEGDTIQSQNISYFPALSLDSLLKKDVNQACRDWCNPDAYTLEELNKNYQLTIQELKMREQKIFDLDYGTDIIISDYIEANYRSQFLFHTYNHPTNLLLYELVRRIFHRLQISGSKVDNFSELLGDISIPPAPCVYIKLEMTFKYPNFQFYGQSLSTSETMNKLSQVLNVKYSAYHSHWQNIIKYKRDRLK